MTTATLLVALNTATTPDPDELHTLCCWLAAGFLRKASEHRAAGRDDFADRLETAALRFDPMLVQ